MSDNLKIFFIENQIKKQDSTIKRSISRENSSFNCEKDNLENGIESSVPVNSKALIIDSNTECFDKSPVIKNSEQGYLNSESKSGYLN